MQPIYFHRAKSSFISLAIACLVVYTVANNAAGQTAEMPRLDESRFARPSFCSDPIVVENGPHCFDVSFRYLAVTTLVDYEPVVVIFDLTNGSRLKEFPMEGSRRSKVLSISPDLERMMYQEDRSSGIKLYDISGERPRLIEELSFDHSMYDNADGLHYFASPVRIITAEFAQPRLRIWDAANGNRIHQSVERYNGNRFNLTPDQRFIYHGVADAPTGTNKTDGRVITFIDVENGRKAGEVTLATSNAACRSPLLSPDGRNIVCITERANPTYLLGGFDAETGERRFELDVPGDATRGWSSSISWLGNDLFIVGNVVCSFSRQQLLFRINDLKPAGYCPQTGDAFFSERYDGQWILTTRRIADQFNELISNNRSTTQTRLQSGDAVNVRIDMRVNAPIRNFERQFQAALENALKNSGYRIQSGAPNTLTATVIEQPTGQIVDYSSGVLAFNERFLGTGDLESVREIGLTCQFTFSDDRGEFHNQEIEFTSPGEVIEWDEKEPIQDVIKKWRWTELFEYPANLRFSRNYVVFNLELVELDVAPDADWLAAVVEENRSRAAAARDAAEAERRMERERENFELTRDRSGNLLLPDARSCPAWDVNLFSIPSFGNDIMRSPLKVGGTNSASCEVMDVKFATINTAQAAVLIHDSDDNWFVDRYDLAERKQVSRTPVEPDSALLDFRPDGKVWAVANSENADRILIYQPAEESGRDVPDNKIVELDYEGGETSYASFAGTSSMLVFDGHFLKCLELPSGQVNYEVEYPESSRLRRNPGPVMSFDRQLFLYSTDQRCELRRSADGSVAGEIQHNLSLLSAISDAAFQPDGSQLALLNSSGICVIDLATGDNVRHVPLDRIEGPIRWINQGTILAKNQLIDLDLGATVWTYGRSYGDMTFMYSSPDNGWYIGRNGRGVNYLVRNAVPSGDLNELINRLHATAPVLLDEGATVSIEPEVDDSFQDGFEQQLVEALTVALESAGYEVVKDSGYTLTVEANIASTGGNGSVAFDAGSKFFTLRDQLLSVELKLESGDETRRLRETGFFVSSADYVINWDAEDLESDFMIQLQDELIRRFLEAPVPPKFAAETDLELGRSEFEEGIEELKLSSFGREISGR